MAEVNQIIRRIEQFAPLDTMQKWDYSGWQINLGNKGTTAFKKSLPKQNTCYS